ncbi:MAG: repeat-containing protein [Myxococcaceae bacterium]|nr:repeat-containing protein [Myxococcaceae bacterium]
MRVRFSLSMLGLAVLAAGCTSDPCADVLTEDEALASTCGIANDTAMPVGPTHCTPAAGTICTIIGNGEAGVGSNDVAGTVSRTYLPQDMTLGPNGRLYFLDWNNHVVREQAPDGTVRTVVGTGELSDGEDPPIQPGAPRVPSPALRTRLNHPTSIAFDGQGNMLIAAWHNSMIKRVRNVGTAGSMIEDLCGTGGRNFAGDGGPALMAVLDLPVGVAISPAGEVYIADQANQRIRRVNGMDVISTFVGTGMAGYAGDNGPALMAQLRNPVGQAASPAGRIDFDSTGNLYIADTGNNAIRRVTPAGVITTVAGTGVAGATGDGGPATMATLNQPTDVEVGPDGTLYIADTQNSCVRAVGADGNIRTVAGRCGTRGFEGDGASPLMARLDRPYGVETDNAGRLFIADTYNQRIRVVMMR